MSRKVKMGLLFRLGVIFTLVVLSVASLYIGSGEVSVDHVTHILTGHVTEGTEAAVVWQLRFPRTFVALLTGLALGMAGATIQTMTHNPLAEPGLLGVNSGASLVVAAAIVFFSAASFEAQLLFAMIGALVSGIIVLVAGGVFSHTYDSVKLMLAGSALSALSGAATRYLIMFDDQAFASFRSWASGEVSARPWRLIAIGVALILMAFIVLLFNFSSIDSLGLGEDMGRALGAHPRRTWFLAGIGTVILSAVSVTLSGPIFFLGLTAPMLVRWNTGPKARDLTIWSGVAGAGILLAADLIGRVIVPPQEISAANICGLIGAPLFVVAARRARLVSL